MANEPVTRDELNALLAKIADRLDEGGQYLGVIEAIRKAIAPAPKRHVRWINLYPDYTVVHDSPAAAAQGAASPDNRIACVRVEFVEGEGL